MLVVAGHIIPAGIIGKVIYTYHVAFFMLLAGFTAYGRFETPDFIRRKAFSLLLPCATWVLLGYLLYGKFKNSTLLDYLNTWIHGPDYVWFLLVLFLIQAMAWLIHNASSFFFRSPRVSSALETFAFIAFYIVLDRKYQAWPLPGTLVYVSWYFPFFIAGYTVAKYQAWLSSFGRFNWLTAAVAGFAYMVLLPYWQFYDVPLLPAHIIELVGSRKIWVDKTYIIGLPLLAMLCTWAVLYGLQSTRASKWLAKLGRLTLPVYVAHFSFTGLGMFPLYFGGGWTKAISMTTFAIAFSLGLYFVLRRSSILSAALYGEHRAHSLQAAPALSHK